jgi:hypothetical protein
VRVRPCGSRPLKDADGIAERTEARKRVLVVAPKKTRGVFDLVLRGTEEARANGRRLAPRKESPVTWRWAGRTSVRAGRRRGPLQGQSGSGRPCARRNVSLSQ